jgi:hypothetical protein
MTKLELATLCNRYEGRPGWVIGRGPTLYQYQNLATVDGPVFFINDSVCQEIQLAAKCDSFFFAHDESMAGWLGKIRSTAVLVTDHLNAFIPGRCLIRGPDDPLLQREGKVILYNEFGEFEQSSLLERSRDEIARSQQLYVKAGTIHSLLHFAWYVGCSKLYLIGCDGLPNVGYDRRLQNLSNSNSHSSYVIRHYQDIMLRILKMPVEYIGTPLHRVTFELKIAIQEHRRSEVIEFLDEALLLIHKAESCIHINLDQDVNSENIIRLWIQSDNYQEIVNILEKCDAKRKVEELTIQGAFVQYPLILMSTELY